MKKIVNEIVFTFRMPKELSDKVDKFAKKIELPLLPIRGGYKSYAMRLLIEDSLNRYMGPKNDPDELVCPFADEMSKILPVLRNIRLVKKLDEMPDDISHNKGEIDKIIKEFS